MPNKDLGKLKEINGRLARLLQLVRILNTYLEANQDCNENCANALTLLEIIFAEFENMHDNLFDYLVQTFMEMHSKEIVKTQEI